MKALEQVSQHAKFLTIYSLLGSDPLSFNPYIYRLRATYKDCKNRLEGNPGSTYPPSNG